MYLSGHKDLFNSGIVGYTRGDRLTINLANQSLLQTEIPEGRRKDFCTIPTLADNIAAISIRVAKTV